MQRLIFGSASDERVDLAFTRLLVEVDAVGVEGVAFLLRLVAGLGVGVLVGAARRARFRHARPLSDTVTDIVDRVVAGHVLLLQEVGGVALALGEDRHQNIGAGHLLAAGRLHVDDGALDDPLEPGRRLRILVAVVDQVLQLALEIGGEAAAQLVEIDVARPHDRGGVLIVDQRQQQVLEGRIFMVSLVGQRQRAMQGLLEIA